MTTWVIISWALVLVLTGINILIFLQLKKASDQMMKMVFPGSKNMADALGQMQKMGMGGMAGMGARKPGANSDAQLKAAMDMLQQMTKKK